MVFFLGIPLPPTSPSFPYTTLFRSVRLRLAREVVDLGVAIGPGPDPESADEIGPPRPRDLISSADSGSDRKSTRLNSSHRCISYAVFCLKKKRNDQKKDARQWTARG